MKQTNHPRMRHRFGQRPPQIESADIGDVRAAVDLLAAVLAGEIAL